jgi:adenylylsulfate kinase
MELIKKANWLSDENDRRDENMVLWLIGISGAGKTTIGLMLKEYFQNRGEKCCLIDGDEVRNLFDNDLGYSKEEREANIKRIILAAYVLDKSAVNTIVCNISPFEHLREICRRKIDGYNEIYLKKDLLFSIKNDVKGVYLKNTGKTDVIGIDIAFDEPAHPDLTIEVDHESVRETYRKVIGFIEGENG